MAGPLLFDRVKESTLTTGTGTLTLAGAANGFQSFAVVGNGNQCFYTIANSSQWETGIGTYSTSGTTLSRDTVLKSSNSNALVNFSAGSKDVFIPLPAVMFNYGGYTAGSVTYFGSQNNLAQDSANFFWDSTNKRFGIGTNSPTAKLHIVTSAGSVGQIIKGAASQTANFFEIQNNAGTVLVNIDNEGQYFSNTVTTGSYLMRLQYGGAERFNVAANGHTHAVGEMQTDIGFRVMAFGAYVGVPSAQRFEFNNTNTIAYSGAAGNIALIIKGAASQTGNLTEWQNSSGTAISFIDATARWHQFQNTGVTQAGVIFNSGGSLPGAMNHGFSIYHDRTSNDDLKISGWEAGTENILITSQGRGSLVGIGGIASGYAYVSVRPKSGFPATPTMAVGDNIALQAPALKLLGYATSATDGGGGLEIGDGDTVRLRLYRTSDNNFRLQTASPAAGNIVAILQGGLTLSTSTTTAIPFTVKGASSQTANLQEWQNSSGTVLTKVTANGSLTVGGAHPNGADLVINSVSAPTTSYPFIINQLATGYAVRIGVVGSGQLRIYDNSDTAGFLANGLINAGDGSLFEPGYGQWKFSGGAGSRVGINTNPGAQFHAICFDAATIGSIIQGFASQTANLSEWRNSSGSVIAKITAAGGMHLNGPGYPPSTANPALTIHSPQGTTAPVRALCITDGYSRNICTVDLILPASYSSGKLTLSGVGLGEGLYFDRVESTTNYISLVSSYDSLAITATNGVQVNSHALFGSLVYLAGGPPAPQVTVIPSSSSVLGLLVKGAASQSANLTEWQNSSGTVLSKVIANGSATFNNVFIGEYLVGTEINAQFHLFTNGVTRLTISNDGYVGINNTSANAVLHVKSKSINVPVTIVQGMASQAENLTEWWDSTGATIASVSAAGVFYNSTALGTEAFTIYSENTTYNRQIGFYWESGGAEGGVKSLTSLIFKAGGTISLVASGYSYGLNLGTIASGAETVLSQPVGNLVIASTLSSRLGLVVRGAASQAANLQEWQNSAGATLASIGPTGIPSFPAGISFGVYRQVITLERDLGEDYGDWVELGSFATSNAGGAYRITLTSDDTDGRGGAIWEFATNYNFTADDWKQVGPTSSLSNFYPLLEVKVDNDTSDVLLRLHNPVAAALIDLRIIIEYTGEGVWTETSDTGNTTSFPAKLLQGWAPGVKDIQLMSQGVISQYNWTNDNNTNILAQGQYGLELGGLAAGQIIAMNNVVALTQNTQTLGAINNNFAWSMTEKAFIGGNASPSGVQVKIVSTATTNKGLIVQGAASQTANLTEWQNSAGTALAAILPGGAIRAMGSVSETILGTDRVDLGFQAGTARIILEASSTVWEMDNAGGMLRFLTPSTARMSLDSNGRLALGSAVAGGAVANSQSIIQTNQSNISVLILKGAASQTADLQQWQNSAGTVLSYISSDGQLFLQSTTQPQIRFIPTSGATRQGQVYQFGDNLALGSYFVGNMIQAHLDGVDAIYIDQFSRVGIGTNVSGTDYARLFVLGKAVDHSVIIARAVASQSRGIQEWQDSSGNVLSSITATGGLLFSNNLPIQWRTFNSTIADMLVLDTSDQLILGNSTYVGGMRIRGTVNLFIEGMNVLIDSGKDLYCQGTGAIRFGSGYAYIGGITYPHALDFVAGIPDSSGLTAFNFNTTNTITNEGSYLVQLRNNTSQRFAIKPSGATTITLSNAAAIGLIVKSASLQTANIQEWQDSGGGIKAAVLESGAFLIRTDTTTHYYSGFTALGFKAAYAASRVAFCVSGTDTYWVMDNGTGAAVMEIESGGGANYGSLTNHSLSLKTGNYKRLVIGTDGGVSINGLAAAAIGLTVKGAASQTGNLTEWQNSSGTALTVVTSDGKIGVKESAPAYDLEVGGPVGVAGFMVIGSGLTAGPYSAPANSLSVESKITIGKDGQYNPAPFQVYNATTLFTEPSYEGSFLAVEGCLINAWVDGTTVPITYKRTVDIVGIGTAGDTVGGGVLRFLTNPMDDATAVERMRIERNGYVGIGTNDPQATLHIKLTDANTNGLIVVAQSAQNNANPVIGIANSSEDAYLVHLDGYGRLYLNPGNVAGFTPSNLDVSLGVTARNTSIPALSVHAVTSYAANLLQCLEGGGGTVLRLTPESGRWNFHVPYGSILAGVSSVGCHAFNIAPEGSTAMIVATGSASNKGLLIRGFTSQTANLQEWQNSSGTAGARIDAARNFSRPGSGSGSEQFGVNASASGDASLAVGPSALSSGTGSVAIGTSATASEYGTIAIGYSASATSPGNIAIGFDCDTSGTGNIFIGSGVLSGATAYAFGAGVNVTGNQAIAIGYGVTVSGTNAISIGYLSAVTHDYSISLGISAASTDISQFIVGSTGAPITTAYFGKGVTHATPAAVTINATGGSGTNIAGAALTLAGGKATGNAAGGSILFKTSDAGSTGTTLQSLTTKMELTAAGLVKVGSSGISFNAYAIDNPGTTGIIRYNTDTSFYINQPIAVSSVWSNSGGEGYRLNLNPNTFYFYTNNFARIIISDSGVLILNQTTTDVPLAVRGAASQTGNLQEWQNSSGTAGARVNSNRDFSRPGSGTSSEQYGLSATATGTESTAIGFTANASASYSTAVGNQSIASGNAGTAFGWKAYATGNQSTAVGHGATSAGIDSAAFGLGATSAGLRSLAVGKEASSAGTDSTAVGTLAIASADLATAIGKGATASVQGVVAIGYNTSVTAGGTAIGYISQVTADYSLAVGTDARATAAACIALGDYTRASGTNTTIVGVSSVGSGTTGTIIGASNTCTHNEAILLGTGLTSTANQQMLIGNPFYPINEIVVVGGNPKFRLDAATRTFIVQAAASHSVNLQEWQNSSGTAGARVTANRDFSRPGSGTSSEQYGLSATAGGNQSVAIGASASSAGADSVALGYQATTAHQYGIAIGSGANTTNYAGIAIGIATNAGYQGVGIGVNAVASGISAVAIGISAQATNNFSIAIGPSIATGVGSIAINGTSTTANEIVVGSSTASGINYTQVYIGSGKTEAAPTGVTIQTTGGLGTDIAGAALTLAGGKATGSAVGGSLLFQTSDAGSTGTTLQSLTTKMTVAASGNVLVNGFGSSTIGLTVKAAASQSVNLQEWQDSAGTVGAHITALGEFSFSRGSGVYNEVFGNGAGRFLTGDYNVLVGLNAGYYLSNASQNTGVGFDALSQVGNGGSNTAVGVSSLRGYGGGAITGCTAIGNGSGTGEIDGTYNTYLGQSTSCTGTLTYATAIGANASVTQSNSMVLGRIGVNAPLVGINVTAPLAQFHVITRAAATVGCIVKAAASQTANLVEIQNSSGTNLAYFNSSGRLGIGMGATATTFDIETWHVGSYPANIVSFKGPSDLPALEVTVVAGVGAVWEAANGYGGIAIRNNTIALQDSAGNNHCRFFPYTAWTDDAAVKWQQFPSNFFIGANGIERGLVQANRIQITGVVFSDVSIPTAQFEVLNYLETQVGMILRGDEDQEENLLEIQNFDEEAGVIVDEDLKFIIRQPGGTAAVDEAQFYHDGTSLIIAHKGASAFEKKVSIPFIDGYGVTSCEFVIDSGGPGVKYGIDHAHGSLQTIAIASTFVFPSAATYETYNYASGHFVLYRNANDGFGHHITWGNGTIGLAPQASTATPTYLRVTDGASGYGSLQCGNTTAGTVGLIVRGITSQTANFQEWQNSGGTVQLAITKDGYIKSKASNLIRMVADDDPGNYLEFFLDNNSVGAAITVGSVSGVSSLNLHASGGAGSYVNLMSSGSVVHITDGGATFQGIKIESAGVFRLFSGYGGAATHSALICGSPTNATVGLTVKGAASQSANLVEIQNSGSSVLAKFDSAGFLTMPGTTFSDGGQGAGAGFAITSGSHAALNVPSGYGLYLSGSIIVTPNYNGATNGLLVDNTFNAVPAAIPLILKLHASQTANAFEVRNSSSATLAAFDALGVPLISLETVTATGNVTKAITLVNTTSNTTQTLPTAASVAGKMYKVKNINSGTVTVATTSSQTIDGATTQVLGQWDCLTVVSDGSNWSII